MSRLIATVAVIGWMADWHLLSRLPLLTGFPPAVLVFGITWLFCGWVWPFTGAAPTTKPWMVPR